MNSIGYINTLLVCGKVNLNPYKEDMFWAKVHVMDKLGIDLVSWLKMFISLTDFNGADLIMNLFSLLDYTKENSELKIILDSIYEVVQDYDKIFVKERIYKNMLSIIDNIRSLNINDVKLILNRIESCRIFACHEGTTIILDKKRFALSKDNRGGFRLVDTNRSSELYSLILMENNKITPIKSMKLDEKIEFIKKSIHKKSFRLLIKELNDIDTSEMFRICSEIDKYGLKRG